MKALVYTGPLRLEVLDRPTTVPGAGEVLVRVMAVAICGSDVHGYTGTTGRRIPPVVMGHEASGVIDAAGLGVHGWAPGSRVTFDSIAWCGRCAPNSSSANPCWPNARNSRRWARSPPGSRTRSAIR